MTSASPVWLALRDDFLKLDWVEIYKYPTVTIKQMRELLIENGCPDPLYPKPLDCSSPLYKEPAQPAGR
ncbi:hypothetical protein KJZ71_00365 [Patescibacteria group bacterium]|nr:hypothetical protein [Patescibacteria group bacterium]MDL1953142.1 hypothetical protein [Candidatus Uhrbacteria bacterium UHB]RIL00402.1 MAG: hypothetical protein DCC77_02445 [Candidatus Uhrbacteria bacterium]